MDRFCTCRKPGGEIRLDGAALSPIRNPRRLSTSFFFGPFSRIFNLFDNLLGLKNPNLDEQAKNLYLKKTASASQSEGRQWRAFPPTAVSQGPTQNALLF